MENLVGFTFAHPHFFEPLSRFPQTAEYVNLLKRLLPDEWRMDQFDVWLSAYPSDTKMPDQGFKIHVSTQCENAEETLRRVVPECVRTGTLFKVAAGPMLLRFLNSKRAARGSGAKFMTIYPHDQTIFRDLIAAIHRNTADLKGPYILSDRRYGESGVVFYRYGGFRSIRKVEVDGSHTTLIVSPSGENIPDERLPYFQMPEWVEDPFPMSPSDLDPEGLLHDRYQVLEALAFSNAGGVYRATDTVTGHPVVIKEARPFIEAWAGRDFAINAVRVLGREHEVLKRLAGLPWVPQPVDFFQEWEHTFLASTFLDAVPLAQYRAYDDVILIPYMHITERVTQFAILFRTVAAQLIRALEAVHTAGVVLGDLSPNNILIDPATMRLWLIDFESAYILDQPDELEEFSTQWFTQGFRQAGLKGGKIGPDDDYFALGRVLFNLLLPVQSMFDFEPAAGARFLDAFFRAGIPREIRDVIELLLGGCVQDAKKLIEQWNPTA